MSDDDTVQMDTKKFDKLLKALKAKPPEGRIGILGKGVRKDGGETNASIGAKHEFGDSTTPMRSWLRMPLTDQLGKALEKSQAFDEDVLRKVIMSGSVRMWLEKIMITAEAVVLEGFDTGGFGQWKPSNMQFKQNKQTLVETGQLRDAVTTEVID